MKLERLRAILAVQNRTKIFVVTEQFCLCGYASQPRPVAEGLRIHLAASVRVVLGTQEILEEPETTGALLLTEDHRLTRRMQTHRRHTAALAIPDAYYGRAHAL